MRFCPHICSILKTVLPVVGLLLVSAPAPARAAAEASLSPTALVATKDGRALFIAGATGNRVLRFDTAEQRVVAAIPMPAPPLGLALSADGEQLFVTCAAPESKVCVVGVAKNRVTTTMPAGHTAMAPVPSPDGQTLYVCNRFNDDVSFLDLGTKKERLRVKVRREPVAAALTAEGRFLLVANHLPSGPADADEVSAVISVIDTAAGKVVKELRLPNGSGSLQDLRVSPDGKFAVVSHILSRFHLPTTQLDRGWMNTNAKTIIDLARMEVLNTVLLDNVDSGAANPWGIAWSADSATVVVTHAGTHDLSVVDFVAVLARLAKLPAKIEDAKVADYNAASRIQTDVPNDLAFLVSIRQRLKLPAGDRGPRAVAVIGTKAYVANYFSDTLAVVDWAAPHPEWTSFPLAPKPEMSLARQGEFWFNDATICFQGWQSCASCHPGEARVDGLNWDLLNDGIGNPKNTKSMLFSHRTPPAMSMGVRDTAEMAVRAGLRHILFTVQPDAVPGAIDEYLRSLKPVPSPVLNDATLKKAAARGKKLFVQAGCAVCHPPGNLFTDQRPYDVGTRSRYDKATDLFDTPTLIELWRTAPYLHDGSALTLQDVFSAHNPDDRHGKTSNLSPQELDDLCAYLSSL